MNFCLTLIRLMISTIILPDSIASVNISANHVISEVCDELLKGG